MCQHDPTFAIITCIDDIIYKIDELSDNKQWACEREMGIGNVKLSDKSWQIQSHVVVMSHFTTVQGIADMIDAYYTAYETPSW